MTFFQSAEITSIVIAFISLVGVCFTAWMTYVTKRETREINRSVNHIKPGEKRLYELAVDTSMRIGELHDRVGDMESKLNAHINRPFQCPLAENRPDICLFPLDA